MAIGRDRPPSWWRRARPAAGLIGVLGVLVGLGVGLGVGTVLGGWFGADSQAGRARADLAAGAVEQSGDAGPGGPVFEVQLRNGGESTVTVSRIGFEGVPDIVVEDDHVAIPAGEWRSVRFAAPPDCFPGVPSALEHVEIWTRGRQGDVLVGAPLPGRGEVLLDYHETACAPRVVPRPDQLHGIWALEEAYGAQFLVGSLLWRFDPDGTFVADSEGLAFLDVRRGVEGRYSIGDEELVIDVEGGYDCAPGSGSTWRPSLRAAAGDEQPRLTLAWVEGTCPEDLERQIWVLRRIPDRPAR